MNAHRGHVLLLVLTLWLTRTPSVRGEDIPVRDGLVIRISAAEQAANAVISESAAVTRWPGVATGSAARSQAVESARPRRVTVGDGAVLRFDGVDDFLRYEFPGRSLSAATIVVLAAPHRNPGEFRAFVAANAAGQRDYQSGFNIDLGPAPSSALSVVNVEGPGFGGARDLADVTIPFGQLTLLETTIDPTGREIRLRVDGDPAGSRPFEPHPLALDQLTLGARVYTNGPGPQQPRGFLAGDIAEVLVFDRVLSDAESSALSDWLSRKYRHVKVDLPETVPELRDAGVPLIKVTDAPLVQMLQPGFRVRELPLQLTNVNNVRYRRDGRLVTLGYNGDVHLLSDTDGDGCEDRAEVFWKNDGRIRGPIGLALTPPDFAHGQGVLVPSKGKVSLIVDRDGDDRADEEVVIASGWQEIPQNVDAVGIALDDEHNIYFGLGTANYADAYLIGDDGVADYDIHSVRGTIQKIAADLSTRETVCTGVRFPVALAFNRHGDLFCTDQEGATWLPNGNPFDELLWIQPGRHYGFPPRHPEYNPGVIDEPSVVNYSPQHQSTCGLVFNESVNGGPVFGPAYWAGDAIICGESRGRLWRTTLVPTDAGYVAATQALASLQMLTVDACVSPDGALVVACHSGPPDWGTGPAGIGRLFRIEPEPAPVPRVVAAWAAGPQELRIAFDHPLDPLQFRDAADRIRAEFGPAVRAADRFENLVPPYAVVHAQSALPRHELSLQAVSVTQDRRTLILNTSPLPGTPHVAITLPVAPTDAAETTAEDGIRQRPVIDLDLSLHGVQASWQRGDAGDSEAAVAWSGWLPHLQTNVAETLLRHSAEHAALWPLLSADGQLTLTTQLDLHDVLRPAVQPGAAIDYSWPSEQVTVTFRATQPFRIRVGSDGGQAGRPAAEVSETTASAAGRYAATLTAPPDLAQRLPLTLTLETPAGRIPDLSVVMHTSEDPRERPIPLERFVLPWVSDADSGAEPEELLQQPIPELAGGDWARGRRVFRSEAAGCFRCHEVGGGEAGIGPNLANLIHRDYGSVHRDIVHPEFAINPDYITHVVVLSDGRVLTGVLQSDGDDLLVGDDTGRLTRIARSDVETLRPASQSVMPKGIADKLSPGDLRDLLTYLMTPPPSMPLESPLPAPRLRTRAEVQAALAGAEPPAAAPRPLRILLVAGPKDHGPGEHDYPAWQTVWEDLLSAAEHVTIDTAWEFPSEDALADADVAIFFQKGAWNDDRAAAIDAFQQRGGGLVYIHWAVNGNDNVREFSRRIGYASWGGRISYRHGPLTLQMHNRSHPILRNFSQLELYDESYWKLTGNPEDVTLLATSVEDGMPTPQMWVTERGGGRVFVSIPGHYSWTFDDPLFRILMLRGIAWVAHEPVDRFNDLVTIGARMRR